MKTHEMRVAHLMGMFDRAIAAQSGPNAAMVREIFESELEEALVASEVSTRDHLNAHLKCWKRLGVPAPTNELQSISAWLAESSRVRNMQNMMRKRLVLLIEHANNLRLKGIKAEIEAGIYDERPDLLRDAIWLAGEVRPSRWQRFKNWLAK